MGVILRTIPARESQNVRVGRCIPVGVPLGAVGGGVPLMVCLLTVPFCHHSFSAGQTIFFL